ncbi:Os06g0133300 [Oryza sativa Japonica Group]|jgi:hypothetical protein|uniref:Os06g0133300 protein n=7 Tax=Oryza TaxID=4527 RepID=A0A0P0WRW0_ORYSJ|nr:hypothetical protein OsI_21502 [Oryza sativa Indica Group]KAB8101076.1 hypothetical protein EE612_031746 [Oryza sativa]KAF2925024.1 hypothetical protein DAI22_06g021900 [Oryza sativa Japonica Group]BAS96002.1 Os06g0133300 [Oryza sativa Japonica Group]
MAMERFLTSLVFCECEAPGMDVFAYAAGTSLTAAVNKVSTASPGGRVVGPAVSAAAPSSEAKKDAAGKAPRRLLQAAYSPAFDGLNSFETIVMH